jgi:hypothetical protein
MLIRSERGQKMSGLAVLRKYLKIAGLLVFGLTMQLAAAGKTIYVDDDGPVDFNKIQAAINDANDGDTVVVADGIYKGPGNRDIDFNGKAITVRSQKGPENCVIDCKGTESEPHRAFVFDSGEDANSVLDGFRIINGYAEYGGAILIDSASPTISRCTLTANAAKRGGGIRCHLGSPRIVDSNITGNIASAGDGGAIDIWEGYPVVSCCVLTENTAWSAGGAICYGGNQDPTISYCTILRNSATMGGGIMLGVGSATTRAKIDGCTISGNRAADRYYGGGIQLMGAGFTRESAEHGSITNSVVTGNSAGIAVQGGSWTITNCTVATNTYTGIEYDASNNSLLANTILWNNGLQLSVLTAVIGRPSSAYVIVSNSNIEGGLAEVQIGPVGSILEWKDSNTALEPRFAGPGRWDPNDDSWVDGDYHLKSQAGRWEPAMQAWVKDDVTSPCIDAGDPMTAIGQEPFPNGGLVNMGAYGGTAEASKSYFGLPTCEKVVAGDINGDCKVDFRDFVIMTLHWLEDNTPVNSNSVVKDGIEYYLQTNKSVYHLGEDVEILYRITNVSEDPLEIAGILNCEYAWSHFVIRDSNNTGIWEYIRGVPPCGWTTLHLDPHECKEYQKTWNMINDNGTWKKDDDFPAGPGSYNITGELELDGGCERVPVSVRIKIIP